MFKFAVPIVLCFLALVGCGGCFLSRSVKDLVLSSREAVVKIKTGDHGCTGFHIGNGLVVTAGHCLEETEESEIFDAHGHTFKTKTIIDDDSADLGILMVEGLDVDYLMLGEEPDYGERLVSMGYPWYAGGVKSFEVGYLKWITQTPNQRFLVSDAISFRGESGGPCLDERGFVVGVVVAVAPLQDKFERGGKDHQHKDLSLIVSVLDLKKELATIQ